LISTLWGVSARLGVSALLTGLAARGLLTGCSPWLLPTAVTGIVWLAHDMQSRSSPGRGDSPWRITTGPRTPAGRLSFAEGAAGG